MSTRINDPKYLIGNYRYNGVTDDYSGNNNNGTWSGTPNYSKKTNEKYAAELDGSTNQINHGDVGNFITTDEFSVAMTVNADPSGYGYLISRKDGSTGWAIYWANVAQTLQFWTNGACAVSSNTFRRPAGETKIVVTYNNQTVKFYADGEYIGGGTSVCAIDSNTHDLLIGNRTGGATATTYFDGQIGDVRLYNCELTADEVNDLFMLPDNIYVPVEFPKVKSTPLFSPISSYGFNNGLYFQDNSGSNDGNNNGVTIGKNGGFEFDDSSYIAISPIALTGDFTILALVKTPSPLTSYNAIVGDAAGSNMFGLSNNANNVFIKIGGVWESLTGISSFAITTDEWQLLTITRTGTTIDVYRNDVKSDVSQTSSATFTIDQIGRYSATNYYLGGIRGLAFYDKALTADQIAFIYSQSIHDDSLILAINDGLTDNSKNKIDLTLTNCTPGSGSMVFSNGGIAWASQTFTSYEYTYITGDKPVHYFYDGTDTYTNGILTGSMPVSISATGFSGVTAEMRDIRIYNVAKLAAFIGNRYIKTRRIW